ncbi:glycosyltransferase [Urbifossiella limnaea]|uniref:Teichuronic acid biosynthesis glycosyltransferase TuaH n=1 Tax=Urbifossiella limnaea TaxID=2528023 RepID=A0A517Y2H4_9BACT|nr:glycosyltransferase [Urbifossiella limnaea]QDU23924.1 Putative teichuronic acid biosynthesis glycosyltransferase TuaH [Urbifossiella limnaea]
MPDPTPLVVFSDDWGRHPSSCQHLISHLLPTRPVVWVNTIGTRPPRLDRATLARVVEKLKQWGRPPSPAQAPAPRVLNPRMWPSFRGRFARGLNRHVLGRAVRAALADLAAPPVVVTTLPITADLVGTFPAARWVYYCVDDFAVWPGLDGRTMRDMEAELAAKVDAVVAVSETLQRHLAALGRPSHLLTHGVDLDHFRRTPEVLPESLRRLDALAGPLVVFWGVIDRRMDTEFVRVLAASLDAGTVLLVGPQDDPDPALLALPRVATLPPVPYADLPALAARAAVLVMPYADLPVTRAMQPLKLKEYLATGKPVVVRELPATREWSDCLDAAATPAAFAAAVRERLATGVPAAQADGRKRLNAEGWAAKAAQFAAWLNG